MAPEDSRSPNADTTGRLADLPECRSPQTHQSVILVADDDLQVRKLVTRLMEQDGHFVLSAADGQEALELSRRYAGSIALLITGVRMPRLNGTDLCAHLLKERPEIKVIFSINADLSELFAPSADMPHQAD
jgi:CheY-like chemotaxis protein